MPERQAAVAEVSALTLGMAIQAVQGQIRSLESLLTSETVRDPAVLQDLIFTYERAAEELKSAYLSDWSADSNLPSYETLLNPEDTSSSADITDFPKT